MFFFFKQKTAYEMRISDWSSDVCSSDLARALVAILERRGEPRIVVRDLGVELHVIEAFAERLPCGFAEVARRDMLTATVERQRDVVIARQRLTADAEDRKSTRLNSSH